MAGSAEPAHCCLLTHRMGLFASLLVQAAKSQLRRQQASLGCGALEAKEHMAPCQAKTWAVAGVLVNDGLDSPGIDKGEFCTTLCRVLHRVCNRPAL